MIEEIDTKKKRATELTELKQYYTNTARKGTSCGPRVDLAMADCEKKKLLIKCLITVCNRIRDNQQVTFIKLNRSCKSSKPLITLFLTYIIKLE